MTSSSPVAEILDPVQTALDHLKDNLGYQCGSVLGKGTYGSVIQVTSSEKKELAAKIVERRMINEMEIHFWPLMKHRNILKLIGTIDEVDGVVIFLTDLMATNLFMRLQDKNFRGDSTALDRCQIYAKQVLTGIAYLHRHNLCHLDIRSENVFLSVEDDRAVVADFSGLCWSDSEKKFCPLPHSLRPPEMLTSKKHVQPEPVDLWACGLLLANLFLGKSFYVCTVKNSRAGYIEAVHQYTEYFQCEGFVMRSLNEAYTSCFLLKKARKDLISIIHGFLQLNPKSRQKAEEALSHPFLSKSFSLEKPRNQKLDISRQLEIESRKEDNECILRTAGNSEEFKVTITYSRSDEKNGIQLIPKDLETKGNKSRRWFKYKPKFLMFGKLSSHSKPFFKGAKFKSPDKKKGKISPMSNKEN